MRYADQLKLQRPTVLVWPSHCSIGGLWHAKAIFRRNFTAVIMMTIVAVLLVSYLPLSCVVRSLAATVAVQSQANCTFMHLRIWVAFNPRYANHTTGSI